MLFNVVFGLRQVRQVRRRSAAERLLDAQLGPAALGRLQSPRRGRVGRLGAVRRRIFTLSKVDTLCP
jgi:hypothetical protein